MNDTEYKQTLNKLNISIEASAKLLGVSRATAFRWARGESKIPEPAARLLRVYRQQGLPAEIT